MKDTDFYHASSEVAAIKRLWEIGAKIEAESRAGQLKTFLEERGFTLVNDGRSKGTYLIKCQE